MERRTRWAGYILSCGLAWAGLAAALCVSTVATEAAPSAAPASVGRAGSQRVQIEAAASPATMSPSGWVPVFLDRTPPMTNPVAETAPGGDSLLARDEDAVGNGATADTASLDDGPWSPGVTVGAPISLHYRLPIAMRGYTPPRYGVVIEAVLYDGIQLYDYDEAVLLLNGGDGPVDLAGWQLCKWGTTDWACAGLPARMLGPRERVWLARSATGFANSFGFGPDHVLGGWPGLHNSGDEVVLRDAAGGVRDALVYELGDVNVAGWAGVAVWPYSGAGFASEGQVLYRYADERSGLPPDDTDGAADWAQYPGDAARGRRVRYPGWDLERFFRPAVAASGLLTVGIAPDNAYHVVVDTIRSADERLELELYTFTHEGLVGELVQQAQQGISVTVLLEGGPAGGLPTQELWACQQLHATGRGLCYFMVNSDTLRIDDRYTFLHTKMIVVDRERVLIGSQNLTSADLAGDDPTNGTGGSRGVVLVTDAPEVVARAVDLFEADCDPLAHADISLWGPGSPFGLGPPPSEFVPDSGDWTGYAVQFPEPLVVAADTFELISAPESALRSSDSLLGLVGRAGAGGAVYIEQLYEYA